MHKVQKPLKLANKPANVGRVWHTIARVKSRTVAERIAMNVQADARREAPRHILERQVRVS